MEVIVAIALIALLLYWGFCDYPSGYPPIRRKKEEEDE
jgi:hypothetical protein